VQAYVQQFCCEFKAASGGGRVGILTLPPRTAVSDNSKWTTIAGQVPDSGFVTSGLRDQHNSAVKTSPGSFGCDYGVDTGSICNDPTTTSAWRVSAYSATTTASVAAGAASATVTAAPNQDDVLVYDAGDASVDTNASIGAFACSITGSSNPYTIAHTYTDAYSNTTLTYEPASAHGSGAPVSVAYTPDGIHPSPNNVKPMARLLAPYLASAYRR